MRLIRRHSLILVGGFSFLAAIAIGIYLLRQFDTPLGEALFIAVVVADPLTFAGIWFVLRRGGDSPSPEAVRLTLRRGRPVVIDIYSNT